MLEKSQKGVPSGSEDVWISEISNAIIGSRKDKTFQQ